MQSSEDVGNTFGRAWQLLASNPNILVPAIVLGIIGGVLTHVIMIAFGLGTLFTGNVAALFLGGFLALVVATIVQILTVAVTTGMGVAAWRTGRADYSDGSAVFSNSAALATIVLWMAIGIVLAIIPVLGWIADIVLFFVLIYAVPSAVINRESAAAAFKDSMNVVSRNFTTTLIIVVLIALIGILGGVVGTAFAFVPFLGKIIAMIIRLAVVCYGTLVITGEYLKLAPSGSAVPPPNT